MRRGGHLDIVKFFISKGNEHNMQMNWNWGMYSAAQGGHLNIDEFFKSKI
jgi:hypothetical protein